MNSCTVFALKFIMGWNQIRVVSPKGIYCRNASFSTLYSKDKINNFLLVERALQKGIHLPTEVHLPKSST